MPDITEVMADMLMKQRQALLVQLGGVEDALIILGKLNRRSVIPKHEREEKGYNPPQEVTTKTY